MHSFLKYQKQVFLITASVLEKIICEYFKFEEFSIVAAEEVSNGASIEYNLEEVEPFNEWAPWHITEINAAKLGYSAASVSILLSYLILNDVIPSGYYVVDCSW